MRNRKENWELIVHLSPMASELPGAGLSFQSSDRNHSVGIFHTMYLAGYVCPSAPRSCSSHTCEPIQNHCDAHPKCGSTALHVFPPTMPPPAWHHDHLDQNFHPTCHPTSPNHHPHSAQPIYQYILCCLHVHHTSRPTYYQQYVNIFTNNKNKTAIVEAITRVEDFRKVKVLVPTSKKLQLLEYEYEK